MFPEQKPDKLTIINKLVKNGEFKKALTEVETFEKEQSSLSLRKQIELKLLKLKIFEHEEKFQEMLKLTEELLNNSQSISNSLSLLDTLFYKAKALNRLGELGKGLAYLKMAEKIIAKGLNVPKNELYFRKAAVLFEKGFVFEQEEELKSSLKNYLQSQSLRREIDDLPGLAESNTKIAELYLRLGDIVRALIIFKQSLEMFQELNDEVNIACIYNEIGKIYLWKGDYGPALENCLQSLAIAEEIPNEEVIVKALLSLSTIYSRLGEFDRAISFLNRSLSLTQEMNLTLDYGLTMCLLTNILIIKGQIAEAMDALEKAEKTFKQLEFKMGQFVVYRLKGILAYQKGDFKASRDLLMKSFAELDPQKDYKDYNETLFWLIILALEENRIAEAKSYLDSLQKNIDRKSNQITLLESQLASALILKKSNNNEILAKARRILTEIVNSETLDYHLKSIAYFNLVEVLLKESQNIRNEQLFPEINQLIAKHFQRAQEIDSKLEIVENIWLKANAALLQYNVKEAQLLFEEGENLSEETGLQRLGLKFTRAITVLKNNLPEQPLSTTLENDHALNQTEKDFESEIVKMIDKQTIKIKKIQKEEPVLLLIVYEGGVTVFSKKFSSKEMIDEMFVGGFLTAIDAFMHQTFATRGSIEKIQHQEYTLLLKIENPLLFCYVYKGQSFTAVQKLNQLIQRLKNTENLWNVLTKNHGEQINSVDKEGIGQIAEQTFLGNIK